MAKGGRRKKSTQKPGEGVNPEAPKTPQNMVFHTGDVHHKVRTLETQLRRVMEPHTAAKLRVRRKNVLKDFINVAGPLNVTNFMIITQTTKSVYIKVCRVPRGPTLTFRVKQYSNINEIQSLQRRPYVPGKEYLAPALLILNNFNKDRFEHKLLSAVFQNMFASVDVKNVRLASVQRCVLLNYDAETDIIEFRHYLIKIKPTGLNRGVKKVVIQSKIPDMNKLNDISDYILGSGALSDSEFEDDESSHISLPQTMKGAGMNRTNKTAVRLNEIGPRLTMQLQKVEQGLCEGDVLYHSIIKRSKKEIQQQKEEHKRKLSLKAQRKAEQEENVRRKKEAKEAHKEKCLSKDKDGEEESKDEDASSSDNNTTKAEEQSSDSNDEYEDGYVYDEDKKKEDDDDNEYYLKEVGVAPEEKIGKVTVGGPKPKMFAHKRSGGGKGSNNNHGKRRQTDDYLDTKKKFGKKRSKKY